MSKLTLDFAKINHWQSWALCFSAYLLAGWWLTGLDEMPEARVIFLSLVGAVTCFGLIAWGMTIATEGIGGKKVFKQ